MPHTDASARQPDTVHSVVGVLFFLSHTRSNLHICECTLTQPNIYDQLYVKHRSTQKQTPPPNRSTCVTRVRFLEFMNSKYIINTLK